MEGRAPRRGTGRRPRGMGLHVVAALVAWTAAVAAEEPEPAGPGHVTAPATTVAESVCEPEAPHRTGAPTWAGRGSRWRRPARSDPLGLRTGWGRDRSRRTRGAGRPDDGFLTDEDFIDGEREQFGAQQGGDRGQPDLIGPLFEPLNPARLHLAADEWFGFDFRNRSERPKPPEVPEPLFYDLMRPLGALKYDNEANYLVGAFSGPNPTLQLLELEYVVADWRAVELQLNYNNGVFVAAVPGYQRTLGVGPKGNWVHAYQIQVPVFIRSDIVGGRAAYFFAWEPEKESPFSMYLIAGAERVAVESNDFRGRRSLRVGPTNRPFGPAPGPGGRGPDESQSFAVWRPLVAADFFYTIDDDFSVGVENDVFAHSHYGEYLVLPQFVWQPLVHFTVKVGIGYFLLGNEGQATFITRVMLTQPSPRRPRDEDSSGGRPNRGRRSGLLSRRPSLGAGG